MEDRTPSGRAGLLFCCAIVLLFVVLPVIVAGVGAWLLLRKRDRLVARYRDSIVGQLPDGCAATLPAAAVRAYREFLAELERPHEGGR